jgi:hypothetical protein
MATEEVRHTLSERQSRQHSTVRKTTTPRWPMTFLSRLFEPGLPEEVSPSFQLLKKL